MRMYILCIPMTKVISLSEKAYGTLKKLKRQDESFSDVVLRLSGEEKRESILRFAGTWKGDDIDEVFSTVIKDRKRASSRKIEI
jgi:predicted CopG family antitoxin